MNLYQLTGNYLHVLEMADQLDEETLVHTLESINESIEQKAENTAKLIRSIEAESDVISVEIKRLQDLKKTKDNKSARIKEYLQSELLKVSKRKVQTPYFNIRIQNNPPSVRVTDESLIGKKYFVEQEPKLDKRSLLQALKSGESVAGAELQQKESLRIS